jgi:hypothetical protein
MAVKDMIRAEYVAGETYPIALEVVNGRLKVVKPKLIVVSGSPGYESWYYPKDIGMLLYLEKGMFGRRVTSLPWCGGWWCDDIKELVKRLWIDEGKSEEEIERVLNSIVLY